jgi:hypothetical protein
MACTPADTVLLRALLRFEAFMVLAPDLDLVALPPEASVHCELSTPL